MVHEKEHIADVEDCSVIVWRRTPREPKWQPDRTVRSESECRAYKESFECLKKKIAECVGVAQCEAFVEKSIRSARSQGKKFCGLVGDKYDFDNND